MRRRKGNPIAPTNRRRFLAGAAVSGVMAPWAVNAAVRGAGMRRPNIVFILVDDMGYADISCYGRPDYATPAIDGLARDGVKFTQGYANSAVCSATRTALATGRYQQRFRIGLEEPVGPRFPGIALPAGTPTIASRFRDLGYRTALIGKWHVGNPPEHGPDHYGYDYFFGPLTGAADYFSHKVAINQDNPDDGLWENDRRVERSGYMTDILGDEAVAWIDAAGDDPFLLSLHFTAPHWPWEGPDDRAHSKALTDIRDESGGSLETFGEMVVRLDRTVARVLDRLEENGVADDTIVVFTSDNGGERYSDTWPLTGYKGELLEGGIRVPLILRWPGRIAAGSRSNQVMASMDFAPTLLALAGATSAPAGAFNGADLAAQVLGEAAPVERTLCWRFKANDQAAIRDGDWKYLKIGGQEHLFHVADDPRERAERKAERPDIFTALKSRYAEWDAQMLPYKPESFSEDVKQFYPDRY